MADFSGHLLLRAAVREDGRTALAEQSFRAPYHLSKPYWDAEARVLLVQVVNPTAGILSGDRSKILATEAPEISSLLSSYDAQRKAQGELQPRGGGRSAYLNEQPYKEAGDVNKLIERARPEAAKNLTQTSEAQSYLGQAEQGLALSDVQSSLQFLLGKAGIQLDSAKLQGEQGAAMGQAAGSTAAQLVMMAAAA